MEDGEAKLLFRLDALEQENNERAEKCFNAEISRRDRIKFRVWGAGFSTLT